MSLKITTQECHITRDTPVIRTRVPREEIEKDDMVAKAVRHMRLSPGDHLLVQCMNHERAALLAEAKFVIVSAIEEMKTETRADMTEHTVPFMHYRVVRKGEWWEPKADKTPEEAEKKPTKKAA
jgi:hypothetical protein